MSLENFQLPITLIPELYKNSLVQLEEKQTSNNNIEVENIRFLGRNIKNILILVDDSDAVHLSDAFLDFLSQILQACKLNLNEVAIVNQHQHPNTTLQQCLDTFQPSLIIDFGNIIQKWKPTYHAIPYQLEELEHCKLISANSLVDISQQPDLKKSLWLALKAHFKL